jgi:integrase
MGTVFRKTYTDTLPPDAVVRKKRRRATAAELRKEPDRHSLTELVATWTDRKGTKQTGVVTTKDDGTQRVRVKTATYYAKYRDGDGIVRVVSTGCRDAQAAKARLAELERKSELVRAKVFRPEEAEAEDWQAVPMTTHIADYIADLRARGCNADRIKTSETYLTADAEACGFRYLHQLSADALRRHLREQKGMSAATYNWHAEIWTAFGGWLTGKRIENRRSSMTGERRITSNPFEGFGRKDRNADRRREARSLDLDEMRRLLDTARKRPLWEAMTVRTGPNAGERTAKVSDDRRAELERLGNERALIYKTFLLTGLRANELRTLRVGDLSFGDVPFLVLRVTNEKSRKGSTVPLRDDLAADLKRWTDGRAPGDLVFYVPTGLLRILNRDLEAAGIPKVDEHGKRIHLHALRHSTGTHLSKAGVSPRTAQAVMRHSDIALTMRTYTDERLLDSAGAVQLLPDLPLDTEGTSEPEKASKAAV